MDEGQLDRSSDPWSPANTGTTYRSMTGCSGVNVIGNISGQNVTLTANVIQQGEPDWMKQKAQMIHERTITKIKTWTRGMVRTSALEKVLEKLNKGANWLTIKGSPGEGKTTCAYMALEELHRLGRQVFQVVSPDEYLEVTKVNPVSVIMLDDILGDLEFDHVEWLSWKSVLRQILEAKEHISHQPEEQNPRDGITVILVGRDYVFNTASIDLGKLSDFISHEKHVVVISQSVVRDFQEKLSIWNALVTSNGIEIDEEIINEICSIDIGHGFPHVCRLFVTAYRENGNISAVTFFASPLQFLNQTIMKLLDREGKFILFKEIIKGDGKVSIQELGHLDNSYRIIRTANDMTGTYLRKEDDCIMFDHPSIYDCVAYNLCELYPLFVIENCKLSFIHQRLRLQQIHQELPRSETELVVHIPRSYIKNLAKRFASEIEHSNLFYTLSHSACTDRTFVEMMMSMVTLPMSKLLNLTGANGTLLTLIASNKSPELCRYINCKVDIWQNQEAMNTVMYGVCKYAASDILAYLTENRYVVDLDASYDSHYTLAMEAAWTNDFGFIDQIMDLKPDVCAEGAHFLTLLHILCDIGHISAVERAIAMGADINAATLEEETPLYNAYAGGHMDIVRLLIMKGATTDLNVFTTACSNGDMEAVELMWEKGFTTEEQCSNGASCLAAASRYSQTEIMEFLFGKGVSVNITEGDQELPLHEACCHNQIQAVQCLMQHGGDVNGTNSDGYTPLHIAASAASHDCFDVLLKAGADVNIQSEDGYTPLHQAATGKSKEAIDALLKAGADVNVQSKDGYTPLHKAAESGSKECVGVLLKAGGDMNVQSNDGYTPLHIATEWGSKECVDVLLKAGADVNVQSKDGYTPLHKAAESRSTECVDVLLKAGADVNVQSKDGYTPLHKAAENPSAECLYVLLKAGGDLNVQSNDGYTPLHTTAGWRSAEYVDILLNAGSDVNAKSKDGYTSLHIAAWCRSIECVDVLLKAGAAVNLKSNDGYTPLHTAIQSQSKECVDALLKAGAHVNAQSKIGDTPLSLIVDRESTNVFDLSLKVHSRGGYRRDSETAECVDALLEVGANVNVPNNLGQISLHKAVYSKLHSADMYFDIIPDVSMCETLIRHGLDINKQDRDGNTPLHLLCRIESEILTYNDGPIQPSSSYEDVYRTLVTLLIDNGADVNKHNNRGEPALHGWCQTLVRRKQARRKRERESCTVF